MHLFLVGGKYLLSSSRLYFKIFFFSKNEDVEDIPECLLLKLMQTAVKGATDCDKIKMNAVRAIGNLLQLIRSDLIVKSKFMLIVDESFTALTKNCTSGSNMKVSRFF